MIQNTQIENNILHIKKNNIYKNKDGSETTVSIHYEIIRTTEIASAIGHCDDNKSYYGFILHENNRVYKDKLTPRDMWEDMYTRLWDQNANDQAKTLFQMEGFKAFEILLNRLEPVEFSEFTDNDWFYNQAENTLSYRFIDKSFKVTKTSDKDSRNNDIHILELEENGLAKSFKFSTLDFSWLASQTGRISYKNLKQDQLAKMLPCLQ